MNKFIQNSLEKLVLFNFKLERYFFRKYLPKLPSSNIEILKEYLNNDHEIREHFIAKYGMAHFDGLHPKNVFNYRNELFVENVDKDDVVLDVACGTGLILNKIAPFIKKGYGLDYDDNNINICNSKHKKNNLEFIKIDIFDFDYKNFKKKSGYNTAIFSHFLEHVEDPVALLKKVDAQKVLICVPSDENWLTQLRIHLNLPYKRDISHFKEYSRKVLLEELTLAGYKPTVVGFNAEGEIFCAAYKS